MHELYSSENVCAMSRNIPRGQVEYTHLFGTQETQSPSATRVLITLMHSSTIQLFDWREFIELCSISTLEGTKSFDVIITSRWYALTIIFKPAGYSAALETIKPSRLEGEKIKYF